MKDYMFLFRFREGFDPQKATPDEFQKVAAKWQAWTEKLMKEERIAPGQQLSLSPAKVVRGKNKRVQDGPFAEGKEVVGSHCTIKAHDFSEALEIAKGCPILDQDGSVEIREMVRY